MRYSEFWERKRQGRGNEFPLPVSPTPHGDIHHGPVHGEIRGKDLIRLPAGYTPDTAARRLHPGYGCSPDITTHCPRPRWGRGRSAAGAGGVGAAGEFLG